MHENKLVYIMHELDESSNRTRYAVILLLFLFLALSNVANAHTFQEIWGYLMKGEEEFFKQDLVISDIGYFSAAVNEIGRLSDGPCRSDLVCNQRVHLVISAPANLSLMYWVLSQDSKACAQLIDDIVQAASGFDGVQIDFETIRPEDKQAFVNFLRKLRSRLPSNQLLSVALPARTETEEDAFPYSQIAEIVDRVIIMAYDEHWRTGSPGAIASLAWCQAVSDYAKRSIPNAKLVMGLPFYGRVWQEQIVARALKYSYLDGLLREFPSTIQKLPDGTGHFRFQQTVDASVYFENVDSLTNKLAHYEEKGIRSVAFWRLGQEQSEIWSNLKVCKEK